MPDVVVRSETLDNMQVEIMVKTRHDITYYEVTFYKEGRVYNGNVYSLDEKKQANACFNRYKRKMRSML